MNFLEEILSSSGRADIESSAKSLSVISSKITIYKDDVASYIKDVYVKYNERPNHNEKLLGEITELSTTIDSLKQKIESLTIVDVVDKQLEVDSLKDQLNQSETATNCILSLMQIHEKLANVGNYKTNHNYIQAAFELAQVDALIKNIPNNELLDVFESLKLSIIAEKGDLLQIINEIFEQQVIVKEGKQGLLQTNSIKIQKHTQSVQDVLTALALFNMVGECLNNFTKFFWHCMCKPIISNITQVRVDEDESFHILTVVIKRNALRRSYKEVFNNLVGVFKFLQLHLNYEIKERNIKTHSYIGSELKKDLFELLVKDCLGEMLPTSESDRISYQQVIDDTKNFQNDLIELEIFTSDVNPLLHYANNMELMLANLKCEEYSVEAIRIMKKDLHDMVEVGVHYDAANPLTDDQFPECAVSRSAIELLQQAQSLLRQVLQEPSTVMASGMIGAMQSVFYQYGSIVYGHHEKLLHTIPQQVVLYRNNCMYLAHQLSQLNEVYSKKLPNTILAFPPIFKDQPHQLRTVGGDIFLGYVESHIKTMENTLAEYKFEPQQLSENMCKDTDKCLRQCLRQYELLKTVWHKVLPHAVYNKTLGYLLNTFCKKLIYTILEATDISFKNAERLVEMYKVIQTRGPKLFTDPEEVNLYVALWQKFNEIIFILGASLIAIDDRWGKGDGPLSVHFSVDEVKHLIKALFQNTDRRATVLCHIVNSNVN